MKVKVKELIEILSKFDQDAIVYSIGFDACLTQVSENSIKQTIFYKHENFITEFKVTDLKNDPINVITIEGS